MALADLAPELGSEVAFYLLQMELERKSSWTWKSRAIPGATVSLYKTVYYPSRSVDCTLRLPDGITRSTRLSDAEAGIQLPPPISADDQIALGLLGRQIQTFGELVDAIVDPTLVPGPQMQAL